MDPTTKYYVSLYQRWIQDEYSLVRMMRAENERPPAPDGTKPESVMRFYVESRKLLRVKRGELHNWLSTRSTTDVRHWSGYMSFPWKGYIPVDAFGVETSPVLIGDPAEIQQDFILNIIERGRPF